MAVRMLAHGGSFRDVLQAPFFVLNAYLFLYSTDQYGLNHDL